MSNNTGIEWTDSTWNPIGGCSIKSPGCAPCYAQKLAGTRLASHPVYAGTTTLVKGKPVFNGHLTAAAADHATWTWPLRWRGSKSPRLGVGNPSLIFVGDMSDLFHEDRKTEDIDRVVAAVIYSRHIGQLLTKRPEVMCRYFEDLERSGRWIGFDQGVIGKPNFDPMVAAFDNVFLPRLWLGTSAERQREFDERWPWLRRLAELGFTVFVSYEPAIGRLRLPADFLALGKRAWLIAGGMSGDDAKPAHRDWFWSMRDQCAAAGVPFLFKQWGAWARWEPRFPATNVVYLDDDGKGHNNPAAAGVAGQPMVMVGKKAAGRLLGGREWNEFPEVRT